MTRYADIAEFRCYCAGFERMTREDFLRDVKFSTIDNIAPYRYHVGVKEIVIMQATRLVESEMSCPEWAAPYTLYQTARPSRAGAAADRDARVCIQWMWRKRSRSECPICGGGIQMTATANSIVAQVDTCNWMSVLDMVVMYFRPGAWGSGEPQLATCGRGRRPSPPGPLQLLQTCCQSANRAPLTHNASGAASVGAGRFGRST